MSADHESASLEAVDLNPVEGRPYLQAYLEAYLEPYREAGLEARPRLEDPEPVQEIDDPPLPGVHGSPTGDGDEPPLPEEEELTDGAPGDLRPEAGEPADRRLDDEEAPDQELVDREPYLQAYLEPYLEACLEPADLEPAGPEPAGPEPTIPEPVDAGSAGLEPVRARPANLRASDLEAPAPGPAAQPAGAESGDPDPEPAEPGPAEPEVDPELAAQGDDELLAAHVRRRAEAARLATSIRWVPPAPARQSWAPLASASLVAGQVRRQLVPCLSALRSVGLDGCAYQLQRLDHVLERIATVPEAPVAYGPDM